jgi:hypothetical protein
LAFQYLYIQKWGLSSAGRAPALHAGGQRFDPASLHHTIYLLFRSSSVVEQSAVNRSVVGSNPTCGAIFIFGEVLKWLKRRPWKGRRSGNRCEGSNPSFSVIMFKPKNPLSSRIEGFCLLYNLLSATLCNYFLQLKYKSFFLNRKCPPLIFKKMAFHIY